MGVNKGAVGIFVTLCAIGGTTGYYLATSRPQPVLSAASPAPAPAEEMAAPLASAERVASVRPAAAAAPPAAPAARPAPARPVVQARRPQPAPAPPLSPPAQAPSARPGAPPDERPTAPAGAMPARTVEAEPVAEPVAAAPRFLELVVPAESVIGLQVETSLTSERARVEDEVIARVIRDVRVDDRVAIPSGARAHGIVTLVERGGRLRERARLGIRFSSVVLADGTRLPLETETIYREGDSPAAESTAKIGGGAIGGAIIGGILGGAKGAMIGGSVGAGAGTAAVYAGGRNAATLPSGTPLTVRLLEPASVTVDIQP